MVSELYEKRHEPFVRTGSDKRIASGVGEGSICVQFVHRALGSS